MIKKHKLLLSVSIMVILLCSICLKWGHDTKYVDTDNCKIDAKTQTIAVKKNAGTLFANVYEGGDSPKENIKFSGKDTVEKLKMIFEEIKFYEGYNKGDLNVYDDYAEKYTRLLKREVKFYDPEYETHNYIYFYDPETLIQDSSVTCYLFDMDGDAKPELCMTGVVGAFIFKYIPDTDQYVLWWKSGGGNHWIMGSSKICQFSLDGSYHFTQLSKAGNEEYEVFWGEYATREAENVYMVSLPVYEDGFREVDITEGMSEDGYYEEWYYGDGRGRCFFRVTEEEYHEVTEPFFEAHQRSIEDGESFIIKPWLGW